MKEVRRQPLRTQPRRILQVFSGKACHSQSQPRMGNGRLIRKLATRHILHSEPTSSTWMTSILQSRAHPIYSARHGPPPKIIVKKEPLSSPEVPSTSRHRPRKLDLTSTTSQSQPTAQSRPSAPLTARDSGGLAMHDVGLACLSPGFQTQDPGMREQLQRSISVRDQQRHIIELRRQKGIKPPDTDTSRPAEPNSFRDSLKTPLTSKKRPPPGLSIVPPSHEQFANERVIQSAPLHQSFTGRHQQHPLTRHITNQPSNLSNTSHIHHVRETQSGTRLPPISDVFAGGNLGVQRENPNRNGFYQPNSNSNSSHSNHRPAFPSPGLPPPSAHPVPAVSRSRDYRSAEEVVAEMAGGREELLPKIVHYGGHQTGRQPPTPPSPLGGNSLTPNHMAHHPSHHEMTHGGSGSGRRRPRVEYERDMGTPPLGSGPESRRGPFGEGMDSPDMQRKKKEEFLGLCARAWDLFHS